MTFPHEDPQNNPQDDRLIPEADYKVKCVAHKFGRAGTGTEQIGVKLQITEGNHKGQYLTWYGFFTEAAIDTTIKSLRALGLRGDDLRNCSSMYEGEAIAVVQHEVDRDNNKRARVRWINGADVAMNDVMNERELGAFASRMRGSMARFPSSQAAPANNAPANAPPSRGPAPVRPPPQQQAFGGNGRQPPPRQQQPSSWGAPPPSDDDIPF